MLRVFSCIPLTLSCADGASEVIGSYRLHGRGNITVANETCNNNGGYILGINSELENRAVAGESRKA